MFRPERRTQTGRDYHTLHLPGRNWDLEKKGKKGQVYGDGLNSRFERKEGRATRRFLNH